MLDVHVIKTDSAFNESWSADFGGYDNDQGFNIMPTNDGGYITIGNTWSYCLLVFYYSDIYVVKLDSTGYADGISTFNTTQSSLNVFPNPATNFISIETGIIHDVVVVTISDMTGKTVFQQEFTHADPTINISALNNGIYAIHVKTDTTNSSAMFVKQ